MRLANTETLHLRLPPDLRRDLDAAVGGTPRGLSSVVRRALAAGLKVIANDTDRDPPPPAAPGARSQLPVAA